MFTLQDAFAAAEKESVASLDLTMFNAEDALNLILQRSEIITDIPKADRFIQSWISREEAPLRDLIDEIGVETLFRRGVGFMYLEYLELRDLLAELAPERLADIGCGYAVFDLFAAQDLGCKIVLIDIEESEDRHFGFDKEGSGYTDLKKARKLMTANGIKTSSIRTINPLEKDPLIVKNVDLAVSFLSCGFHFPWQTYETFFHDSVTPNGAILLDIRRRRFKHEANNLMALGSVEEIKAGYSENAARTLIRKSAVRAASAA